MIVRNEAPIIEATLDMVAPYIRSWVIVDTGSDDGTQDLIRNRMAALGIPGDLFERPWRNFGHNRSEALTLAQGHGDYIWVLDADDSIEGTLDFGQLGEDLYQLRYGLGSAVFWRPNLFRDGLPVRYEGVVHEYVMVDGDFTHDRLDGDYYIDSRRLGARNSDPQKKYESDRDLLLAEVERNPDDARSVFYLAQSYFDLADFDNARKWYLQRSEMGGWDEEVYYALYRVASSMWSQGEAWPQVQDAYLRAWEFRPSRAEPLYDIAHRYRLDERYWLGYLFAERAAAIPYPEQDTLYVSQEVYQWGALDELALCASWIDKHAEAFAVWRRVLAQPDLPDDDRQRIAENREICATALREAASSYPAELVRGMVCGPPDADVVVSLVAGPDRAVTELTLNSFLNCCTDVSRVGRFLAVDAGLSAADRATLLNRYEFLEFCHPGPEESVGTPLAHLRGEVAGPFWLHLGQGWQFFVRENLITRLRAVFDAETKVFQVAINYADAAQAGGVRTMENPVRQAPGGGSYFLTEQVAYGPAMYHTERLDRVGVAPETEPTADLGRRAAAAGFRTASLDEVVCTASL